MLLMLLLFSVLAEKIGEKLATRRRGNTKYNSKDRKEGERTERWNNKKQERVERHGGQWKKDGSRKDEESRRKQRRFFNERLSCFEKSIKEMIFLRLLTGLLEIAKL